MVCIDIALNRAILCGMPPPASSDIAARADKAEKKASQVIIGWGLTLAAVECGAAYWLAPFEKAERRELNRQTDDKLVHLQEKRERAANDTLSMRVTAIRINEYDMTGGLPALSQSQTRSDTVFTTYTEQKAAIESHRVRQLGEHPANSMDGTLAGGVMLATFMAAAWAANKYKRRFALWRGYGDNQSDIAHPVAHELRRRIINPQRALKRA